MMLAGKMKGFLWVILASLVVWGDDLKNFGLGIEMRRQYFNFTSYP